VRGWLRRFAARAGLVMGVFTALLVDLADDPDAVLPLPAASVFADAVAAVIGVARAAAGRFPMVMVPVWRAASAVSGGALLAPGWPAS
jgi:hypothetical protein